jgi:hypothetical protein
MLVRTSQEVHDVSIIKTNFLVLLREIIAGYCEKIQALGRMQ